MLHTIVATLREWFRAAGTVAPAAQALDVGRPPARHHTGDDLYPWPGQPYVQGGGPEQGQMAAGERNLMANLTADPVTGPLAGGAVRIAFNDAPNPQEHLLDRGPVETFQLDSAVNGWQDGGPHLPGRPVLPGWDGEPGQQAPAPE